MTNEFTREARYAVLKSADVMKCLTVSELIELRRIQARVAEHRTAIGKPRLECVVVEKDWPEYEPTWKAIEVRMTGSLKESAVPSVPEGWPTEVTAAFARVFNVRDQYSTFPQAFRAALAAAPEPKL